MRTFSPAIEWRMSAWLCACDIFVNTSASSSSSSSSSVVFTVDISGVEALKLNTNYSDSADIAAPPCPNATGWELNPAGKPGKVQKVHTHADVYSLPVHYMSTWSAKWWCCLSHQACAESASLLGMVDCPCEIAGWRSSCADNIFCCISSPKAN